MPNGLLALYFRARGVFDDLDFASMKETQPDELFAAWLGTAALRLLVYGGHRQTHAFGCARGDSSRPRVPRLGERLR